MLRWGRFSNRLPPPKSGDKMKNVYVLCLMIDDDIIKPVRVFADMEEVSAYVKKNALHSKTRAFRVPYGPDDLIDQDHVDDIHY